MASFGQALVQPPQPVQVFPGSCGRDVVAIMV